MQGIRRRVVYVALYEGIAIVVASFGFAALSGADIGRSSALSVLASAVAISWNLVFNWLFEQWEMRQAKRGRSVLRRIAHAIGFEGGLVAILVPLVAWWLHVTLWQALLLDLALVVFFLIYTFVFAWLFDRVFGLPDSARPRADVA